MLRALLVLIPIGINASGCTLRDPQPTLSKEDVKTILREHDEARSQVGRFQIVNGTPGMARNIMLLDTVGGDTWVSCANDDGSVGWCAMFKSDSLSVRPK